MTRLDQIHSSRPSVLTLRQKLLCAFGLLFAALVTVTLTMWWTLDHIQAQAERMAKLYAPQIERVSDVQVFMFRISLEARHLMLVDTEAERQQTVARIVQFRESKMGLLSQMEANLSTGEGRAILARIRAADSNFWRLAQEVVGKANANDSAGAFALLESQLVDARNTMLVPIGELREHKQQLMAAAIAEANSTAQGSKLALTIGSVLVLLFAFVVVWSVLRSMGGAFARALRVIQQIAAGRLDNQIDVRRGDEFEALFACILDMQQRLKDVVAKVSQASDEVITAATELDRTNQDLRSVSQMQSQSVEDTAEHARSISQAIDSSAANADNVSQLANKAAEIAGHGGQAVSQVVQEMQRIGEASKRISEIVSVIDGIAFQTNILALNAAVEAARAGEQGRGFAVVAGEVRSLAQRSTQAAREVKQLIDTSSQRVQSGSGAAENAGQTMRRVVDSVAELSNLMGSIAQATAQQRASAHELDRAVVQLNEAANTSASVVQRAHATVEMLREQAGRLDQAMAVFNTGPQEQELLQRA